MKGIHQNPIKDEINLRELFSIVGRYKWSIIFLTLLVTFGVAVKVYFMPKYYKSTVTIEVKPEDRQGAGFSIGGAAAMLLGGSSGGATNIEKDITLIKTYRTNEKVLKKINDYMVRYFRINKKNNKLEEVDIDKKISINVLDVNVYDFKDYGMSLTIEPINSTQYKLSFPGKFSNKKIGIFHYSETVKEEKFSFIINKYKDYTTPYTIRLSGTKRYIYEKIIIDNLTIEADKKSPFITISYLDNLPKRGENYLKNLIETYTQQSINDIKEDTAIVINSYDQQLKKVQERVTSSSKNLENFKTKNSIIKPDLQLTSLIKELSRTGIEISETIYKQELLENLIKFTKTHENIDAIAPSLIELKDQPTIALIKLIQERQIALSELLIKYKPNHPTIIRADQTIFNLKEKVLSNLKNLKMTLTDKIKSLKNMEKTYNKKLSSSPKQEQQLIGFSRDYQINEKMYLYLLQERSSAQIKHDKALSRFKIVESIYTPEGAVKPRKALIVIVTFITMLILSIFLAFFREFLKKDK